MIDEGAASAVFRVRLKPGPVRIESAMGGQRKDGQVISPFLVDVKYLGR